MMRIACTVATIVLGVMLLSLAGVVLMRPDGVPASDTIARILADLPAMLSMRLVFLAAVLAAFAAVWWMMRRLVRLGLFSDRRPQAR
jgi:hypothetical protein